jgi:pantoate--beta-alanine ligase
MTLGRAETIAALRASLDPSRAPGARVGLVPTMGALHDGHASLIRAAAAENDVVVTTVFVNPLQFAPTDDLAAYPRDLERDAQIAQAAGATLLFTPAVAEMYPFGADRVLTTVSVREITGVLDGLHRPGHFDGVATVVAKLFAIAGPCRAYFGEKDFQQLAVVRRMVADLSFPVEVIGCPIVREPHGLAMSSRNAYLSADQRRCAGVLYRSLVAGREAVLDGERDAAAVRTRMAAVLREEPAAVVDYAAVVDGATLQDLDVVAGEVRLLVAARVGPARLIDNLGVSFEPEAG